jgi:predicted heme/steroid binding protein
MKTFAAAVLISSCVAFQIAATPVDTAAQPACTATAIAADSTADTLLCLTIADLAKYNGKDGMPAYVAVDSVIYDQTGVKAWKSGKHEGGKAGTDITTLIKNSPHGKAVLKKRKVVGKLIATK